MRAQATFTSNLAAWEQDFALAIDGGLKAAAAVYESAIKERLRLGYTTGAFTTGKAADSVFTSDPVTEHGVRVIRIGTGWIGALEWELGFVSRWDDEFHRVETWRPIAVQHATSMAAAFVSSVRRDMAKWRAH